MTSNRFIHKRRRGKYSRAKSLQMNKARWDADRARRDAEMPERILELAMIEMENLLHKLGDPLGCFQWSDFRSGKVRRWVVRIGNRSNQVTLETPGGKRTVSHGGTWVMNHLRSWIFGHKQFYTKQTTQIQ
jgi:hypothetical protein